VSHHEAQDSTRGLKIGMLVPALAGQVPPFKQGCVSWDFLGFMFVAEGGADQ